MSTVTPSNPVQLETVRPDDGQTIKEAFDLGCQFKAKLGLQVRGAYEGAASDGHLLVARREDRVVGFVLYGVAYQRVRLAYLCVSTEHRRSGIATKLVEHLSAKHHDLAGIRLKCRQDYGIDKLWIDLGFHKRSQVRGRSQAGYLLDVWWRDHGHPDLFSRQDPPLLRAALDNNMSGDKPAAPGIIGCSQLELDVIGAPADLHDRFQHLGVWELSQIAGAGGGQLRQALRVTNTEIFPHPIPLPRLKVLSGSRRNLLYPLSPRKIEPELFAQIYKEGFDRHE